MSAESRARHHAARLAGGADKLDRERWLDVVEKAIKSGRELIQPISWDAEADLRGGGKMRRQVIIEPDYVPVRYDHLLSLESTLAQMEDLLETLEEATAGEDHHHKWTIERVLGQMRYLLSVPA